MSTVRNRLGERRTALGPRVLRRLPAGVESAPYELFELRPYGPLIGAEVHGVDLREPVGPELFAELDRALVEWKVLFFRDQPIDSAQHRAFARLWGELEVHPFLAQGDVPEVVRFSKGADSAGVENVWHTDVTWRQEPALGSVLRAIDVPEYGGDTLWADMAAAYDNLPADVQERIEGRTAVHDFAFTFGLGMDPDAFAKMREQYPPVEHPVVRTHPVTGRKTLFVNEFFTDHIVGLPDDESEELLAFLFKQSTAPEYQARFRWSPDSVVVWDNRATVHYAVNDYHPHIRVMERAAILGDRPY
ncbi:TauD/TfdA dioxygenase family protein [Yinghuangia seranimata]|uniref:TauD/TfdA dioxygenase family protein n=1 Tax=Yinghuangia seranimata TaxID=408067 RepID=UPI00248B4E61|nr:TauD/TfdA family dioxygenase [Yinghuangia seranimata]MDI2127483.1 TauD/TfdA family dioxygenase [Yinghuangia seranimata]